MTAPSLLAVLLRLSLGLNAAAASPVPRSAPRASSASDGTAAGPSNADPRATVERRLGAMGTVLTLRVSGADRSAALAASEAAAREIGRVEALLSTWRPGGALERLNRAAPGRPVDVGEETAAVLREVRLWTERTDGAFDPTVLPLSRAWDIRGAGRVPARAEISRALAATGWSRFRLDAAGSVAARLSEGAGIDEGAWGKGYALDAAARILREAGVGAAVLDLGGQVLSLGRAEVAIASPSDRRRVIGFVEIRNNSVSTSGNSERSLRVGRRAVGHLLDPATGAPAGDFGSATAVAPSALVADVLSTAFFVLGPDRGLAVSARLREQGFPNEVLFLRRSGARSEAAASPGIHFMRQEDR